MASRHRLFVAQELKPDSEIVLDTPASHYLARVLRLRAGADVELFNGDGYNYTSTLIDANKNAATLSVSNRTANPGATPKLHLAIALLKGDRLDYALQKATELDVAKVYLLTTERSELRLTEKTPGESSPALATHYAQRLRAIGTHRPAGFACATKPANGTRVSQRYAALLPGTQRSTWGTHSTKYRPVPVHGAGRWVFRQRVTTARSQLHQRAVGSIGAAGRNCTAGWISLGGRRKARYKARNEFIGRRLTS